MNTRRPLSASLFFMALCGALLSLALPAHADSEATAKQVLTRSLSVPAGGSVSVENLVGHMDVMQGGSQLEVTATVVAGGEDQAAADALAKTIKLSVTNSGNRVNVHVDYPVDQYDSYRYDRTAGRRDSGDGCLFGFICGSSSTSLSYQGEHVRIYQRRGNGVPLYVDVSVKVPAGMNADLTNHVGLIQVANVKANLGLHSDSSDMQLDHTAGDLSIDTGSGDIGLAQQDGAVVVRTGSGDVKISQVSGNINIHTGSGDVHGGKLHGDTLETVTGSGDVVLDDIAGSLNMRAGSGDIHLSGIKAHGGTTVSTGSGDITLSGDLSGMDGFNLRAGSGDIVLATSQPPAVHLDINTGSGDINVHWAGLSNVATSDNSFSGDVANGKALGKIHTGSGDVTLK
ncbi:MAG TPA: DUF4097 family beta strand repeat-containing protein [Gammaproteobacteria bacterium]|nr:DUF4097 family beta strand repeat-containing protein [Gammaproteobacteria bacterium]